MKEIIIKWDVEDIEDTARITAMYCFKSCSVNEN